jgi:hypothetical protein
LRVGGLLKLEQRFQVFLFGFPVLDRSDIREEFPRTLGATSRLRVAPHSILMLLTEALKPSVHVSNASRDQRQKRLGLRRRFREPAEQFLLGSTQIGYLPAKIRNLRSFSRLHIVKEINEPTNFFR